VLLRDGVWGFECCMAGNDCVAVPMSVRDCGWGLLGDGDGVSDDAVAVCCYESR
jgi:hypothetical protein